MLLGHRALHLEETERDDAQAAALEPRDELAGDRALHRVGFEDHKGALGAHEAIPIASGPVAGGAIVARLERGPMAAM